MKQGMEYVDTLGFLGDVNLPSFDEKTQSNVLAAGVKLVHLTSAWPMQNWLMTLKAHRETLVGLKQHSDVFQIILKRSDLQKLEKSGRVGIILGMQDSSCIGDKLNRIQLLFDEGVRIMQIAYQHKNQNGCGFMAESEGTGLTNTGHEFITVLNEAGLILDLSHLAPQTALDCIKVTSGPVMISHTTARGVYDHPRGSTDEVLRALARLDTTIVGVLTMTFFLDPKENTLDRLVRHIDYIARLIGPKRVAIGSDGPVGGFTDLTAAEMMFREKMKRLLDPNGQLRSRWPTHIPELYHGPNGFQHLGEVLSRIFNWQQVAGILGRNAWRFFEQSLPTG